MNKILMVLVLALVASGCSSVFADASKHTLKSYSELEKAFENFELNETLLVLDNDDTISMMPCVSGGECQYLGGAAWFSWQQTLLGSKSPYRVADTFPELLQASALIFNISNMQFTDEELPSKLLRLTAGGARLLVETARGNENVNATVRQFKALTIQNPLYDNMHDLVQANGLNMGGIESVAGPSIACSIANSRPITYQQGIMYLAGQDKGKMLRCILRQYKQYPSARPVIRNIVFIDDTPENVENVYNAFRGEKSYTVRAYHYAALDKHKKALTTGPDKVALQDKAQDRWKKIHKALKGQLLIPATP